MTADLPSAVWISVGYGAALAVAYGAVSLVMNRWALGVDGPRRFIVIALGGLLARMAAALAAVALVLGTLSVHEGTFMGSFFGVFVVALILEVLYLHRRASATTQRSSSESPS